MIQLENVLMGQSMLLAVRRNTNEGVWNYVETRRAGMNAMACERLPRNGAKVVTAKKNASR